MQKWQQAVAMAGLFFLTVLNTYAQEECATMRIHKKLLRDAAYKAHYQEALASSRQASTARNASTQATVYKIPVVVHVMNLGEAVGVGTNISDEQIYSAITSLNEAYRKKAGSIYDGNGTDMGMEFCLAQIDPNGNPTKGINRVDASNVGNYAQQGLTIDTNEFAIKALSKWDHKKYYNIWVVSQIDGNGGGYGVQGFAYFPFDYPGYDFEAYDGAVMLYNGFGYDPEGTRNYTLKDYAKKNITCIHELGHAFNLYHVFEGDSTGYFCPRVADGCGDGLGDCCTDIPACMRTQSDCPLGTASNSCASGTTKDAYEHNYMDYASDDCQNMFTADQATRARNTFTATDYTSRASLVSTANLAACGCNSNSAPIPRFYASDYTPCPGSLVQFYDESINAPATYSWSFPGGTPQTSTLQNPIVSYANGGSYPVTLQVTSTMGQSNALTKTAYIRATPAFNLPFNESFESSVFPPPYWKIVSDDDSTTWGINDSKTWQQRKVNGSGAGNEAAGMNFYNYPIQAEVDDLVTPILNLQGISGATLTFKVAYKYFGSSNFRDSLYVLGTTDCGSTYTTLYKKAGTNLQTTGSTSSGGFAPASSADWRLETVDLSSFTNDKMELVFRAVNYFGDNLYIDDINVVGVSGAPVADFIATKTQSIITNETISFINNSSGSITSYAWDFGTDATPSTSASQGPIDVSYSSTGSKTISLTVTGPNGTNTVTKTNFIGVVASVFSPQSMENAGIKVYPNPTKDIVYVSAANSQYVTVQVMDVLSNSVIDEQITTGVTDVEVNLSGKPQGIYLLMIKTNQGSFGTRVVKTN